MIARVRIAPVEKWCEALRSRLKEYPELNFGMLENMTVEIETNSCNEPYVPECGGKSWRVLEKSVRQMDEAQGYTKRNFSLIYRACEHMLEMD